MYNARMGELSAHYTANKAAINDSYSKFEDNSDYATKINIPTSY
jgi:hypothetical protein